MEEKIMKSLLGKEIAFALAGTMVLATASCGGSGAVSYTHLDVYKRQEYGWQCL